MDSSNTQPPQEQTVTQSEVERLLAQMGSGDAAATDDGPLAKSGPSASDLLQPYDFRQLSFFSANELRKLRVRHEEFIRSLAARLSIYLRLEFGLQMSKLETVQFRKFVDGLSHPTHLTLLKLEPLRGICLLDIPPRLGLCIVDRELGGPGQCLDENRDLSELEARLLSRTVEIIVSEWCSFWSDMLDLRPVLLGNENNGRFVQTCPPDTMLLVLGMQARMGETVEQMQFSFPYYTLENLILKLNPNVENDEKPTQARPAAPLKWNPMLDDVKIHVSAELPDLELTARQLAQLKLGDTLPITSELADQVRVCLAKRARFIGNLGTSDQRWAVKILQVLKS